MTATTGVVGLTRMQRNRTLGLLVVGHGTAHWYNGMLTVLYPVLTISLGLTYSQVGIFDSGRAIISIVASLAGGYFADTLDWSRWVLSFALISLGVFTALLGFAQGFGLALLWLALAGMGNSLWHPFAMTMLSTMFPKRRGFVLSLHDAGANVFHGVAPIVVGILLGIFSWQYVVRMELWLGLVMGGIILLALPRVGGRVRPPQTERPNYGEAWRSGILRNRKFLQAGSISVCLTMARIGLFTFLPLFLAFELGLNSARQGLYMGVLTFSGAIVAPGAGAIADRLGLRSVLALAVLIGGSVVFTLSIARAGLLLFVAVAIMGGTLFSTRSLIMAYIMSVTPAELGGSSIGTVFSLNRLFGILSPLIAGVIADALGLRFVFYFFGALLFLGALLTLTLRRGKQEEV